MYRHLKLAVRPGDEATNFMQNKLKELSENPVLLKEALEVCLVLVRKRD